MAKERVYEYRLEHNRNIYKAGQVLKLFADDTIAGETPFADMRTKAFAIMSLPMSYIVMPTGKQIRLH